MIYQDMRDDCLSSGEDVTELVFLASLSPTLFWLPEGQRSTCVQPKGMACERNAQQEETHSPDL